MKTTVITLAILDAVLLAVTALAYMLTPPPAPVGLSLNQDLRQAILTPQTPEIGDIFYWLPTSGATSYNVYFAHNPGLTADKCLAPPATRDANVSTTSYVDAPNPGWWKLPTSDTDGRWKARSWCYWVSGVNFLGIEGPLSAPQSIAIGNAGYVFWNFLAPGTYSVNDPCAEGPHMNPPSLNLSDYSLRLWYSLNGVEHDFQAQTLFETRKDGTRVIAVIWHAPSIGTDGFVIPLPGMPNDKGTFGFTFSLAKPRTEVSGQWVPITGRAGNYYTQFNTSTNSANYRQCAGSYFAQFDPMQNVITQ